MFKDSEAFSGFSVNDTAAAKKFYSETLGIEIDDNGMGLALKLKGTSVFIYPKDDHTPATFTVLNFKVSDIDAAVTELKAKGIAFESYDGMTDENNIARFKDPAGNILSVLCD